MVEIEIELDGEEVKIICPKCEGDGCKICDEGIIEGIVTNTIIYHDIEPCVNEGYL